MILPILRAALRALILPLALLVASPAVAQGRTDFDHLATGYALTGSWRVAFLLPSLLSSLLTLGLLYDLARRLHGRRVASIAAASLLFTLQFTFQARTAQIDGTDERWADATGNKPEVLRR